VRISAASRPLVKGREKFDRLIPAMEELASRFPGSGTVEVSLVGERTMARLNREWKGRRGASEVLTFVYGNGGVEEGPVAEVFLCWNRLASAARKDRVPVRARLLRMLSHALCHVEGHSHGDERSRRIMERVEKRRLEGSLPAKEIERMFGQPAR